ncbi:hypothetical protein LTR62_005947 [Meristemomyces frigidus]|uniref:Uncharacterized protein n=1 Tax=Meristemomyces frigidus TaxID=1508187 RepID=A0AAN7TIR9_9PEZI|nr:hypothetical protein LTR62_005947 [Meristemomyces frigidus]
MSKPIAFIIGAGKNIGASTARLFQSKGYRVAQAARSLDISGSKDDDSLLLKVDLSKPETVTAAFQHIRKNWGEPSVVIYNAGAAHFTDRNHPMSVSLEDFITDMTVNTTSVYLAAKEAVSGFETLPTGTPKAFMFTGNLTNTATFPRLMTQGAGKSASAHMIESASQAYADKGFRFYYVDERTATGGAKINPPISGPGHAQFFLGLVDGSIKAPWHATFVENEGYKAFPGSRA